MSSLLRNARFLLQNVTGANTGLGGSVTRRWQTAEHTLAVQKKIEEIREKALLGGGAKRIKSQHKKVKLFISAIFISICTNVGKDTSPLYASGLSNNREIRVFPRTAGNTGISREIPGNTEKY